MTEVRHTIVSYIAGRDQSVELVERHGVLLGLSKVWEGPDSALPLTDQFENYPGIWFELRDPSSDRLELLAATSLGPAEDLSLTPVRRKLIDYLAQTADYLEFLLTEGGDVF